MSEAYTGELPENERPVEEPVKESTQTEAESSDWFEYQPWQRRFEHRDIHRDLFKHHRKGSSEAWSSVFWAGMLIMAGVIFLAGNLNMLPAGTEEWDWIMLGAGSFLLLRALVRVILPDSESPSVFNLLAGCVLVAIGLGNTLGLQFSFEQWWPVILIAVGLSALGSAFRR